MELQYGAGYNNGGVIFNYDLSTNIYNKLFEFDDYNFGKPCRNLSYKDGSFYGLIKNTNTNFDSGAIFQFDLSNNICTNKFGLQYTTGNKPFGNLTHFGTKFYGLTSSGGNNSVGVIFEWDPSTNAYLKKIDFNGTNGAIPLGDLVLYSNKFYGLTSAGGVNNLGVIFEWNPVTNICTKLVDFSTTIGGKPISNLILKDNKFYGLTSLGGSSNLGVIFEWDPFSNIYIKKLDFNGTNGSKPNGNLTFSGNSFYGLTSSGGTNNLGVFFEWNPVTNIFTKKVDFIGLNGATPLYGNDLLNVPSPVAKGILNSCTTFPSITIDNSNNNIWVPIVDNLGDAVAEIKANGNNLGVVNTSMFINGGPVREDGAHKLYLDRNLTITPTVQPSTPVNVRLYLKGSEYEALKNATNSLGQPSGINSINDVGFFKNNEGCLPALQNTASPVVVTGEAWNGDYVLTATVNSFSSFYAASNTNAVLSLSLLQFNARLQKDNALINWKTVNEINTNSFDVERSLDGIYFKRIETVLSYNIAGVHDYSYTDENVTALNVSKIYYRLKQKDNDGKYSYSPIVLLIVSKNKTVVIYPNPANDIVILSFSNNALLQTNATITDMQGKQVKQFIIKNLQEKIDISNLSKGMYVIKIADGTVGKLFKN